MMQRVIKSFVKRSRRLTEEQQKFWQMAWPRYSLNDWHPKKLQQLLEQRERNILEIGFGNGDTLIHLAEQHPDTTFIGIEVFTTGIFKLLNRVETGQLKNVYLYQGDAVPFLQEQLPRGYLDQILLLFPDPWPKKRHHKRRIVQPAFMQLLAQHLKPQGVLQMATDWENYAQHMMTVMQQCTIFAPSTDDLAEYRRPLITKFEQCGLDESRPIFELLYRRNS